MEQQVGLNFPVSGNSCVRRPSRTPRESLNSFTPHPVASRQNEPTLVPAGQENPGDQASNELPQPQLWRAFGFWILNPLSFKSSL